MKRRIVAMLAILCALGMFLTGCGQKETSSSGSANPSKTTVNFEGQ